MKESYAIILMDRKGTITDYRIYSDSKEFIEFIPDDYPETKHMKQSEKDLSVYDFNSDDLYCSRYNDLDIAAVKVVPYVNYVSVPKDMTAEEYKEFFKNRTEFICKFRYNKKLNNHVPNRWVKFLTGFTD
jgi:hypothetical protein